ncbi:MAG: FkbM family methyltransferase [Oscillospiraceae bacterium]|nr:FkbM family methyltransferase [Oscillospiraceae bacterium]
MSIQYDKLTKEVIEAKLRQVSVPVTRADVQAAAVGAEEFQVANAAMLDSLERMNRTAVNRSYREIPSPTLRTKFTKLFKRFMRRMTFWYVEPCMMQQTEFNSANTSFAAEVNSELNNVRLRLHTLDAYNAGQDSIMQGTAARIDGLDARGNAGEARIAALEARCAALSDALDAALDDTRREIRQAAETIHVQAGQIESLERRNAVLTEQHQQNFGYQKQFQELEQEFHRLEQEHYQEMLRRTDTLDALLHKDVTDTMTGMQGRIGKLEKLSYVSAVNGAVCLNEEETGEFRVSFSQSGEDAIIRYIFSALGVAPDLVRYLDLGANHAVHLSNTYSFYLSGARGVLLDANPVLCQELEQRRPGDVVINRCLSDQKDTKLNFYIMNGDGLSTMDYDAAQDFIAKNPALRIEKTITIDSITIDEIIREHFADKAPEIMNIDVEGMEMTILNMIDFEHFRPLVIICEMIDYHNSLTVGEKNGEILDFMRRAGYEEFAFTGINSIFIDQRRGGAVK